MNQNWEKIKAGIKIGDKYQLIRKLPPGGGGPVFLGILTENKRPVHIRFFSDTDIPDMKDFNDRLRTAKKAFEIAKDHVTIPSDYNFHEGIPYVVYGISNIKTLQQFFQDDNKHGLEEVKAFVETLLKMLDQVHGGDVAHLGLSPISIHQKEGGLLSLSLGVLDFGLTPSKGHGYFSRPAADEKLRSVAAYASPEQASQIESVDHRADLYSVGAMAYTLLLCKPPFEGENPVEIIEKVISQKPSGLPEDIKSDGGLRNFLARALQKDPKNRFQSASEMLESFLSSAKEGLEEAPAEEAPPERAPLTEDSPVSKHTPMVIIKVSDKEAVKVEESSVDEITAEIISKADIVPQPPDKIKQPQPFKKPRKAKDKTDLFIKVPDAIKEKGEVKETTGTDDLFKKVPDTDAGDDGKEIEKKEEAPHAKAAPPVPGKKLKKARDKTLPMMKVAAVQAEPPVEDTGSKAKTGAEKEKMKRLVDKFIQPKSKLAPPLPNTNEAGKEGEPKKAAAQEDEYIDFDAKEEKAVKKKPPPPPPKAAMEKKGEKPEKVEKKPLAKIAVSKKPFEKKATEKKEPAKKAASLLDRFTVKKKEEEKPAAAAKKDKPPLPKLPEKAKPPVTPDKAEAPRTEEKAAAAVVEKKAKEPDVVIHVEAPSEEKITEEEFASAVASPLSVFFSKLKEKLPTGMKLWITLGAIPLVIVIFIVIIVAATREEGSPEGTEEGAGEIQTEQSITSEGEEAEEASGEESSKTEETASTQEEGQPATEEVKTEETAPEPEKEKPPKEPEVKKEEVTTKPEKKTEKPAKIEKAATKESKKKKEKTATLKKKAEKKKPTPTKKKKKKKSSSKLEFVD